MSKIYAEISRIVNEDISSRVTQHDVIFEAITNAIHANSTIIKCYFNFNGSYLKEGEKELGKPKVDTIKIVDNGDGITDTNYNSFSKYRTEYKKDLGCKGVGRFVFLKVYNSANYFSKIKELQENREIRFHINFNTEEDLKKEKSKIVENETTIVLSSLNSQYLDSNKEIDRRIELDIINIKNKVLINLIPTLYFYKQKDINIEIFFYDEYSSNSVKINSEDIPNFKTEKFNVIDIKGFAREFQLDYNIEKTKGQLNAFYCANNRTVSDFEDKDLKISMPSGYSGFMLLESKYFDQKVNNERNDFDIWPVKTDLFSTMSWDMINTELKKVISKIIRADIPKTVKLNKEKITEIQEERPYLINYIDENDIEIAGVLDKRQIIEKAKKKFDSSKETVLLNANKHDFTDEELSQAILLAQNELVSYINDRVIVIEKLKKLIEKGEQVESIIHNMIMEKYTTDSQSKDDFLILNKNNLWLLDDRFTTYSYAASDKRVKDIMKDLDISDEDTKIVNDKPDFSIFFSHDPLNDDRLKSVLVELKPFEYKNKSHRKKHQGLLQLREYLEAFKEKEKIKEVYGYLITDIDKEFADTLKGDGYVAMYSSEHPIYHRYFTALDISIFVVSVKTMVYDAEARNKMFLDIIRKNSKINNLFKEAKITV
ncbi:ATP-binding protein [Elizabethkingia anophelis]|nr:ATP-binding protein [Elizabethkingia anophelis]